MLKHSASLSEEEELKLPLPPHVRPVINARTGKVLYTDEKAGTVSKVHPLVKRARIRARSVPLPRGWSMETIGREGSRRVLYVHINSHTSSRDHPHFREILQELVDALTSQSSPKPEESLPDHYFHPPDIDELLPHSPPPAPASPPPPPPPPEQPPIESRTSNRLHVAEWRGKPLISPQELDQLRLEVLDANAAFQKLKMEIIFLQRNLVKVDRTKPAHHPTPIAVEPSVKSSPSRLSSHRVVIPRLRLPTISETTPSTSAPPPPAPPPTSSHQKGWFKRSVMSLLKKGKSKSDQEKSPSPRLFGVPLETVIERENRLLQQSSKSVSKPSFRISKRRSSRAPVMAPDVIDILVPVAVGHMLHFLSQHHVVKHEGMFRLSGAYDLKNETKQKLDRGEPIDFFELGKQDPHVVPMLLKQYLRDLPRPLMTPTTDHFTELMDIHGRIRGNRHDSRGMHGLHSYVERLPTAHRNLLRRLFELFELAVRYSESNKLSVSNLSILFSHNLIRKPNETTLAANDVVMSSEIFALESMKEEMHLSANINSLTAIMLTNSRTLFQTDHPVEEFSKNLSASLVDALSVVKITPPPAVPDVTVEIESPRLPSLPPPPSKSLSIIDTDFTKFDVDHPYHVYFQTYQHEYAQLLRAMQHEPKWVARLGYEIKGRDKVAKFAGIVVNTLYDSRSVDEQVYSQFLSEVMDGWKSGVDSADRLPKFLVQLLAILASTYQTAVRAMLRSFVLNVVGNDRFRLSDVEANTLEFRQAVVESMFLCLMEGFLRLTRLPPDMLIVLRLLAKTAAEIQDAEFSNCMVRWYLFCLIIVPALIDPVANEVVNPSDGDQVSPVGLENLALFANCLRSAMGSVVVRKPDESDVDIDAALVSRYLVSIDILLNRFVSSSDPSAPSKPTETTRLIATSLTDLHHLHSLLMGKRLQSAPQSIVAIIEGMKKPPLLIEPDDVLVLLDTAAYDSTHVSQREESRDAWTLLSRYCSMCSAADRFASQSVLDEIARIEAEVLERYAVILDEMQLESSRSEQALAVIGDIKASMRDTRSTLLIRAQVALLNKISNEAPARGRTETPLIFRAPLFRPASEEPFEEHHTVENGIGINRDQSGYHTFHRKSS